MAEPTIAQKSPYLLDIEAGDYYWCACGRSKNQPFCDGSHQGSEFSPVKFTITTKETKAFCGCKRTKGAPYCDGSHQAL